MSQDNHRIRGFYTQQVRAEDRHTIIVIVVSLPISIALAVAVLWFS